MQNPDVGRERLVLRVAFCALVMLCVAAGTYGVWALTGRPLIGCDDASILFIYARNLTHGHGIVYSVGGERVEGFSSMLHFLICCVVDLFTQNPERPLLVLNALTDVVTLCCLLSLLETLADVCRLTRTARVILGLGFLLVIAFNPSYFVWTVLAIMDSGIYAMLLVAAFTLLARLLIRDVTPGPRDAALLSALMPLLVLSRPEGIGWALLSAACFACIVWLTADSWRSALRIAWAPITSVVTTWVGLLLFRKAYFGYPLPNTYYAKVSSSLASTLGDGHGYFNHFLKLYSPVLVLPLLAACVWAVYAAFTSDRRSPLFRFIVLAAVFTVTGLALPILEGGDHFAGFRMFQNVYPLLAFSLVLPLLPWLQRAAPRLQVRGALLYAAALACALAFTAHASWRSYRTQNLPEIASGPLSILIDFDLNRKERVTGENLRTLFAGDQPVLGIAAAGGLAYGYQGTVDDLLGLNDTRMAHADTVKTGPKGHQSFNRDVFYQMAPDLVRPITVSREEHLDLVAMQASLNDHHNFENQAFKRVFSEPRFRAAYVLAEVRSPAHPEIVCIAFFKRTYLAMLLAQRGFELRQQVN